MSPVSFDESGRRRRRKGGLLSAPEGWRAAVDQKVLTARAPYGSPGDFEIRVALDCGVVAPIAVHVDALAFSEVVHWTTEGPDAREHPVLWMDEERLYLFGGYSFVPRQYTPVYDLWTLTSTAWRRVQTNEPPHRAGGRVAPIAGARAIYYSGGDDEQQTIYPSLNRLDYGSGTWSHDAATSSTAPPAILHAFIDDEPRARYLSACGFRGQSVDCLVHALENGAWRELHAASPDGAPSGRYGFAFAYDRETDRLILFSGAQYPISASDPVNAAQDTWALELGEDPPRWALIAGEQSPKIGRRNGCWALDPVGHRFFAWGGTPDARTTLEGLYVLDLDRGAEGWTRVDVAGSPAARSSCAGVYDAGRKRILFGFGNNANAIYADLWALQL